MDVSEERPHKFRDRLGILAQTRAEEMDAKEGSKEGDQGSKQSPKMPQNQVPLS